MLNYNFQQNAGHWIGITAHHHRRAIIAELAPQGITFRHNQVLGWLAFEGTLTQAELAERMLLEPSSLVHILDQMEQDGLIERQPCPTDRRKKVIRPTRKARNVWRKIVAALERVRLRATRGMTPEQLKTLRQLLETIQHNLAHEETPADRLSDAS